MRYRYAEILTEQDLGASGTKIIDIAVSDPISRITILHYPVASASSPRAHPVANIEKIELVDGSDVLFSLTGYEAHALNVIESPAPVTNYINNISTKESKVVVNLDFGRYLWDPEFALDPKRFRNLQLKLTWDETKWDSGCESHKFLIYGQLFDEKTITPRAFLTTKEIKSYEPTADSYEYTDLPTDMVLRKLIIQAFKADYGVRGLCEQIRLSEDNDKRIPIDGDVRYLRSFLDPLSGEAVDVVQGNASSDGAALYVTAHNLMGATVTAVDSAEAIGITLKDGGYIKAISTTGTPAVSVLVRGKNPHGCVCIPFGIQDDPRDWYDVTKLGSLRLRIKGGANCESGDKINIITQQLRSY